MAFLPSNHVPKAALGGNCPDFPEGGFTYTGYFAGVVPVYVGSMSPHVDAPILAVRNWVPEWTLDVVSALYNCAAMVLDLLGGEPEGFYITITGRFDGMPLCQDRDLTGNRYKVG